MEGERSWFGALVKMAKGVDIGAHGNGISCVPSAGASPSLLLRGVLWKVSLVWLTGFFLCLGILSFSHVLQPSADVKFGSVFSGETKSTGHVSACSELESVELGGFVHTHSETFSVKGSHHIGLFSYSLGAGADSLGLGLPCVFVPLGDWWMLVARVHLFRPRVLSSSLLLIEEEGAQESSLIMAKGCVMSSRSWWGDLTAAIDGTFASVVKSVLAETCAARLRAALIQGVLALTYARTWVLLHTGMESSLLHANVLMSLLSAFPHRLGLRHHLQLLFGCTSCSRPSARTQAVRQQHGELVRLCTSSV